MSNEKPILFKDDMIRAILEGRKCQTRRIMKPQPKKNEHGWTQWRHQGVVISEQNVIHQPFEKQFPVVLQTDGLAYLCPYGKPGSRLWVRETWSDVNLQGAPGIAYRADDDIRDLMDEPGFHDKDGAFNYDDERVKPYHFAVWSEDLLSGAEGRWRPSIHMPRWASRITLEITDVRVERLQDISEEDACAEGADQAEHLDAPEGSYSFTEGFRRLWKSIYGPGSWDANPWVWVVEFKRVDQKGV